MLSAKHIGSERLASKFKLRHYRSWGTVLLRLCDERAELVDLAFRAAARADRVAIRADAAVVARGHVEAPVEIQRRAAAAEPGAHAAVVAEDEIDAVRAEQSGADDPPRRHATLAASLPPDDRPGGDAARIAGAGHAHDDPLLHREAAGLGIADRPVPAAAPGHEQQQGGRPRQDQRSASISAPGYTMRC